MFPVRSVTYVPGLYRLYRSLALLASPAEHERSPHQVQAAAEERDEEAI